MKADTPDELPEMEVTTDFPVDELQEMQQPPLQRPGDEIATLIVAGRKFEDWDSVWVQHRFAEAFPLFKFTCVERDPVPDLWLRLQFKPGDSCVILLGGQLAMHGFIVTRQVAYDANNHGVQLTGKGQTWTAARSSIITKDGNFDGKTFEQVARAVLAPFPVGVAIIGKLDATPFQRLQNEPGEKVWDFLERIARPRGIVLGSDVMGNVLLIGDHVGEVVEQLVEGQNILRMQCVISQEYAFNPYVVSGQTAASDEQHGRQAAEQQAQAKGTFPFYSPLLTPAEQPVWNIAEVMGRAKNEAVWHDGTIITATVVVQGWLRSGQALWKAGDDVQVFSPMAMLNQVMKIQTATFTQDNSSGTLTTLDLVAPWYLKDLVDFNVGNAGAPQPPGDARATSDVPFTAPPSATPPGGP